MRLILVRHGQTDWNARGLYQGWEDRPLTDVGRRTARKVGALMRARGVFNFDLWSSDLQRARDTATLAFGREPRSDARLRELDFGEFAGRSYDENEARFGERFTDWVEQRGRPAPPGGESLDGFLVRTRAWLDERRLDSEAETTVVAVSHGGVVQALARSFVTSEVWLANGEAFVLHNEPGRPIRTECWTPITEEHTA